MIDLINIPRTTLFTMVLGLISCYDNNSFDYEGLEKINIIIEHSEKKEIDSYVKKSLNRKIISEKFKKWFKVDIQTDSLNLSKAQIRLKGDWTDHIKSGTPSYRIKIKNKFWKRTKSFSLQKPQTRDNLNEYLFHKMLQQEDVLSPRYGFIELLLNGESQGLYAYEEHFEKQLVEYNKRREGPIIHFNENRLWKIREKYPDFEKKAPVFHTNIIEAFKSKKTLKSPLLKKQFISAQNLLHSFQFGQSKASDVFDIELMAKYIALIDLNKAFHSLIWHNMRFYFNPITQKLEPICFDGYTSEGPSDWVKAPFTGYHKIFDQSYNSPQDKLIKALFKDPVFTKKYIAYLSKYSSHEYVKSFLEKNNTEIKILSRFIKQEIKSYNYNFSFLAQNAKDIQNGLIDISSKLDSVGLFEEKHLYNIDSTILHPELFINAYKGESGLLEITHFLDHDFFISGSGNKKKKADKSFLYTIDANQDYYNPKLYKTNIRVEDMKYIFISPLSQKKEYNIKVNPWPAPRTYIERKTLTESSDLTKLIGAVVKEKNITFLPGRYKYKTNIIIPQGYNVSFLAGHQLDLVDSANFISFSPVNMRGTKSNPIRIMSSNKDAQSFSVILNGGKCVLEHVLFESLGALSIKRWKLSGSVNFYNTDLEMKNCKIQKNHCEDALNTIRSNLKIDNLIIKNTYADAFDSDFCNGEINELQVEYIGNDGLDFSGSNVRVSNCFLSQIGDKAISCGEESNIKGEKIQIEKAVTGIASKDLSKVILSNILIKSCQNGLSAYIKKDEYGPAKIEVDKIKFKDVEKLIHEEPLSRINIKEKNPF